ncbi:MAG: CoA-binding protein [Acidobacteriota bacterium]
MADKQTIAVVGASTDRAKFGNKCVRAYAHAGWTVYPIHPKESAIEGLPVHASVGDVEDRIDRISLYLPPALTSKILPSFTSIEGAEVWFNPGAATPDVVAEARALGLDVREACSIVDIGLSPSMFR